MYPLSGSGSGTFARKLAEIYASEYPEDRIAILCPDPKKKVRGVQIIPFEMPFKVAYTGHPDWPNCKLYSELTGLEVDKIVDSFVKVTMKAALEFKPDVIHVHHASHFAFAAAYVRSILSIHYIVTEHGTGTLCASQDKRWIPLVRFGLNYATAINAVSYATKKWFLKVFGRKDLQRKTKVITGGVDLKAYPKDGSVKLVEKKYSLKDKRVILFTGKITVKKGVEFLIKAASKIEGDIYIVGGGDDLERLKGIAKERKAKNVHFTGYIESGELFSQFYRRADVFVFPSVWDEPLGLVALEAMASGTPVVASKKGGISMAVKNGYNGFLVRAKSSTQIAKMVNKILDDPVLRAKLSRNARTTVEEKFDWRLIARKFNAYYKQAYLDFLKRSETKEIISKEDITREVKEIKEEKIDL